MICLLRDARFRSKVDQRLPPNGTNLGTISDPISVQFWLSEIVPGYVPFGANLTHFGTKPTSQPHSPFSGPLTSDNSSWPERLIRLESLIMWLHGPSTVDISTNTSNSSRLGAPVTSLPVSEAQCSHLETCNITRVIGATLCDLFTSASEGEICRQWIIIWDLIHPRFITFKCYLRARQLQMQHLWLIEVFCRQNIWTIKTVIVYYATVQF